MIELEKLKTDLAKLLLLSSLLAVQKAEAVCNGIIMTTRHREILTSLEKLQKSCC